MRACVHAHGPLRLVLRAPSGGGYCPFQGYPVARLRAALSDCSLEACTRLLASHRDSMNRSHSRSRIPLEAGRSDRAVAGSSSDLLVPGATPREIAPTVSQSPFSLFSCCGCPPPPCHDGTHWQQVLSQGVWERPRAREAHHLPARGLRRGRSHMRPVRGCRASCLLDALLRRPSARGRWGVHLVRPGQPGTAPTVGDIIVRSWAHPLPPSARLAARSMMLPPRPTSPLGSPRRNLSPDFAERIRSLLANTLPVLAGHGSALTNTNCWKRDARSSCWHRQETLGSARGIRGGQTALGGTPFGGSASAS